MNRNRLVRLADFNRHAVVLDQQLDLLGEIGAENIRARHAGLMHARPRDKAVSETRIEPRMSRGRHPHERITGSHARRERPAIDIGFEAIAKEPGVALVDLFETGNGRTGIDECFGRERRWSFDEHCGPHVASRQIGCRAETHPGSANITTIAVPSTVRFGGHVSPAFAGTTNLCEAPVCAMTGSRHQAHESSDPILPTAPSPAPRGGGCPCSCRRRGTRSSP